MDDNWEFWIVEQHVELGNMSFWQERGRLLRKKFQGEGAIREDCHMIGHRDAVRYGGRYRIRVVKEETVYDSEEN